MRIKSVSGDQPHSSWKGWRNFLKTCEVRDTYTNKAKETTTYYGKTNCNYIVFPNGMMVQNYAFHGQNLIDKIKKLGWKRVLTNIERDTATFKALIAWLKLDSSKNT